VEKLSFHMNTLSFTGLIGQRYGLT